jgi:hypothetical protein
MGDFRRALIGLTVSAAALIVAPAAPAAITIPDPVGDSSAAGQVCTGGCPDISAVHVSEAGGRIVVEVQSAAPWGSAHAFVKLRGTPASGGEVGVGLSPGSPFERFLAEPTRYVYRFDPAHPAAYWMGRVPLELKIQASAGLQGTPPATYDIAPDSGEATYVLNNRDGDVVPDIGDPCPDAAESQPPHGWDQTNDNRLGCPALAPFTHDTLRAEANKTRQALLARWRNPRKRTAALRRGTITVPFVLPAGTAKVRLLAMRSNGPRTALVALGTRLQNCVAGQCPLVARVYPRNLRRLAGKRLTFLISVLIEGDTGVSTTYKSTLRMRAP